MFLNEQKKQALELYINQNHTQQQIANALGICVRTVYNWIKQHAWDRLRLATHQAPALIADNFSSQLVELQNNIASREPGKRYPTSQEMEIMRKLTTCIANTKKTVSLPQVTQMMCMFRAFVFDNRKKEDAAKVADIIDAFLEARSRFGYAPYDLEFGVEKIQSVDPIMNPYADTSAKPEEKKKPNPTTVRVDENGNKFYTVDTSQWSEKVRKIYEEHFGKLPEEDNTNTFATEEKPLIINDLVTDTPATTGNKSAIPATQFQPTSCQSYNPENPDSDKISTNPTATTGNKSAIPATQLQPTSCKSYNPENPDSDKISTNPTATTGKKPAIPATQLQPTSCQSYNPENPDSDKISANPTATTGNKSAIPATQELATPTVTTGNKPAKPINPDPTKPFTYQTKKYTITKNPDGSIRYDNGVTPAVTVHKGGPAKVERHEFFFR
jgi:transposase-like protein